MLKKYILLLYTFAPISLIAFETFNTQPATEERGNSFAKKQLQITPENSYHVYMAAQHGQRIDTGNTDETKSTEISPE